MKLKLSRYNNLFSYPDALRLLYNSLTGNILNLDGNSNLTEMIFGNNKSDSVYFDGGDKEINNLFQLGFLVDTEINEINVVRELIRLGRLKNGDAMLTILPTLDCNFGCSYCYQEHRKEGPMNDAVQKALIKFLENKLLKGIKHFSVVWFGGEPLLALPVIEKLSHQFKEICSKKGIIFSSDSIITNGYLLTTKVAKKLKDLGINSAQITIDGPAVVHNKRRPLGNNRGSFRRIIKNITSLPDDFEINIRINVDKLNKDYIFDLLNILVNMNLVQRVKYYVAFVEAYNAKCQAIDCKELECEEFSEFKEYLKKQCLVKGIPWFSDESVRLVAYRYCIVDEPRGFVVQSDGKLLKCWAHAGDDSVRPLAHLLHEKTWQKIGNSFLQGRNLFEDNECHECKILPVCMGGCPRIRENYLQQRRKMCPPIKYSIGTEVRRMYESN